MLNSDDAFAELAPLTKTKTLSAPDMPETVIVDAPVSAVPPVFNKDQFAH